MLLIKCLLHAHLHLLLMSWPFLHKLPHCLSPIKQALNRAVATHLLQPLGHISCLLLSCLQLLCRLGVLLRHCLELRCQAS